MSTKIISSISEWRKIRSGIEGKTLGFIPTMGALHQGHLSLIHRSKSENDLTLVSIFINPTQFNNQEDLAKYPRSFEEDRLKLETAGVDFLFCPKSEVIYPDGYNYKITESTSSHILCGAHRPGHFDGVLTVVLKLLILVQPNRAYFGEKDYQQLQLVRGLCQAFFLSTNILTCPTIRESDGLAMSSRNQRLSSSGRKLAAQLHQLLKSQLSPEEIRKHLEDSNFEVDYVEDLNGRRFAAVHLEGVRLIDNVPLTMTSHTMEANGG